MTQIFNRIDFDSENFVDFSKVNIYCSSGVTKIDNMHKDQRLLSVMANLRATCAKSDIKFEQRLRDLDKNDSGFIDRSTFVYFMRGQKILEDVQSLILLANYFSPKYSNRLSYKDLLEEFKKAKDPASASHLQLTAETIVKFAREKKKSLREVFEQYAINKKMDTMMLGNLMRDCGFTNYSPDYLESFVKASDKSATYLTYYQFVANFEPKLQAQELAVYFKKHGDLYNDLKADCKPMKSTLYRRFSSCKSLVVFQQELEKVQERLKKAYAVPEFVRMFAEVDADKGRDLDMQSLKFVEEVLGDDLFLHLPKDAMTIPAQELIVPGSELSFADLRKLKKTLLALEKELRLIKNEPEPMMKKYDKQNKGLISEADFK